ncbi:DUF4304 domain-containing protein [Hymenobacter metallilatus]|uniref:DUF4304 domain-containing protein n=1 Tax=Hymenobacter metallilatus TaxID=2493666 RepID=A0A428JLN3_9BACT|nr:DUF4304 domain-containing protein [Hymenobacter metallilatus]RSK33976.1 DUF4304 domain-containing protein [Hymenobacter metallilatus]
MKSPTQLRFGALVSEVIWPEIKGLGHQRNGSNFRYYDAAGWGRIVNVQRSAYNDRNTISFTLNVGLYLLEAERANNWGRTSGPKFLEPDCLVRKRVGNLMGSPVSWYELTDLTPVASVEEHVHQDVVRFVVPYLREIGSADDIVQRLLRERWPNDENGIRGAYACGYRAAALHWLEEELEATIYRYRKDNLLRLKTELLSGEFQKV